MKSLTFVKDHIERYNIAVASGNTKACLIKIGDIFFFFSACFFSVQHTNHQRKNEFEKYGQT